MRLDKDVEAVESARPYLRSLLAFLIYLRWAKHPFDKQHCYTEADAFVNTLVGDIHKSAERGQ